MPELAQLERAKSMMRYFPPKGRAGLALCSVRAYSRLPWPPAKSMEIHSFFISDSPQSQPVPAVRSGVWSKSRHVPGGTGITSPSDSRSGTAETIGVRSVPLLWSSRSVRSVWMGREIASSVGLHRHNTSSPRQKASTGSASVGRCAQRKGLCGHRAGCAR